MGGVAGREASGVAPGPFVTVHRLRFNDTDALGHVNNAVFAVMLEQGRSELAAEVGLPIGQDRRSLVIVRLELDFLREMTWPGEVQIETEVARLGDRSIHVRQRLHSGGELCARAATVLVVMDRTTRRAVPVEPAWREALGKRFDFTADDDTEQGAPRTRSRLSACEGCDLVRAPSRVGSRA